MSLKLSSSLDLRPGHGKNRRFCFVFWINPQELHNQTRFIYGSLRIDSPEVKSCVNIPEIERCEQYEKMSSMRK